MGLLDSIFSNEALKDKALSFLKKTMIEGDFKYVILSLKDDGQFDIQMLQGKDQPVVYRQEQIDLIQGTMIKQLADLEKMRERIVEYDQLLTEANAEKDTLTQMALEQSVAISELNRDHGIENTVNQLDDEHHAATSDGTNTSETQY